MAQSCAATVYVDAGISSQLVRGASCATQPMYPADKVERNLARGAVQGSHIAASKASGSQEGQEHSEGRWVRRAWPDRDDVGLWTGERALCERGGPAGLGSSLVERQESYWRRFMHTARCRRGATPRASSAGLVTHAHAAGCRLILLAVEPTFRWRTRIRIDLFTL